MASHPDHPVESFRRSTRWLVFVSALVLASALLAEDAHAQCRMCASALESPEGEKLASGLRAGILLLLVVPFGAFGTIAALLIRRSRGHRDTASQDHAAALHVPPGG